MIGSTLITVARSLGVTLKQIFRGTVTEQYPEYKRPV
jgi:formate hydrogenlyase subunit 6/NADH:ubiquinone oxidoreductase subunit I